MKTHFCALTIWGTAAVISARPMPNPNVAENGQANATSLVKSSLQAREGVKQRRAAQPESQAIDIAYATSASVSASPLAAMSSTVTTRAETPVIIDTPPPAAVHRMVYSESVANSTSARGLGESKSPRLWRLAPRECLDGGLSPTNSWNKRSGSGCCGAPGMSTGNHWKRGAVSCCSGLSPSGG